MLEVTLPDILPLVKSEREAYDQFVAGHVLTIDQYNSRKN